MEKQSKEIQNQETTFEYTYSALTEKEKKQIEHIKRQYETHPKGHVGKLERIKVLDARVKNTATCMALVLGIVGCLIFGLGLTSILEWEKWILGITLMTVGCIPMAFAYPTYHFSLEKGKKKYGKEILELSEEVLR